MDAIKEAIEKHLKKEPIPVHLRFQAIEKVFDATRRKISELENRIAELEGKPIDDDQSITDFLAPQAVDMVNAADLSDLDDLYQEEFNGKRRTTVLDAIKKRQSLADKATDS